MRFMILVKGNMDTEAGAKPPGERATELSRYHDDLARAGVLLSAGGLRPPSQGFRIRHAGSRRSVIDGPFAEAREAIAGYALIQVKSSEEAMEWARRFPSPAGERAEVEIEVRRLLEPETESHGSGST